MEYRPELDGLRAIAVLAVVFFHAGFPGFEGGFLGVDVFFVISGYLITGIIVRDLEGKQFSFKHFYERRARRILPALFFVIFASLPIAWLLMMPSELKYFSQSLVAVATLAANVFFYLRTGYFEPAVERSPLVHTWSLAVEEQFYLLFPPLLLGLWRFGRRTTAAALGAIGLVSLCVGQWMSVHAPVANFYLLFGRMWELVVGALFALSGRTHRAQARYSGWGAAAGALLLVGSLALFDPSTPFPSLWGLFPILGTGLLIQFAGPSNWVGKALSVPSLVSLGLMSYSVYLWHQPLFAFSRIRSLGELSLGFRVGLCVAAVALAYLSFRFVETPFRQQHRVARHWVVAASAFGAAALLTLGAAGHLSDGFAQLKYASQGPSFAKLNQRLDATEAERAELWERALEHADAPFESRLGTRKVLVLGDSFSDDLYVSLEVGRERFSKYQFRHLLLDDPCIRFVAASTAQPEGACSAQLADLKASGLLERADLILVAAGWESRDFGGLGAFLDTSRGRKTVVFGPAAFAQMRSLLYWIADGSVPRAEWPRFFAEHMHAPTLEASRSLASVASRGGARYVDKYQVFCEDLASAEPRCDLVDESGTPWIIDQAHLSVAGARHFARVIHERRWLEF